MQHATFWQIVWKQFCKRKLGIIALLMISLLILMGIYAPLLASSKPLFVEYQGKWYFPLFRYLLYPGFFTKKLDLFYNLLIFTLPLFVLSSIAFKGRLKKFFLLGIVALQCLLFSYFIAFPLRNPAFTTKKASHADSWRDEIQTLNEYGRLNILFHYQQEVNQHAKLKIYEEDYKKLTKRFGQTDSLLPTLWNLRTTNENSLDNTEEEKKYLQEKNKWLKEHSSLLKHQIMPLIRPFHWEEDAAGDQALNRFVSWWDLTRINRKDMVASLLFGIRISLSVGLLSIGFALLIGIPIGALAGYYGGKFDLVIYRLIEIWESMPTFFMLLMIVAFLQSKSIFLIIAVIALFGWTSFSRFVRGEFFKQKELLYVESCRAMGYPDRTIIFSHLLPNAIPPILTLVPFAIMAAITNEAALSFLGLSEEGSNSWGVLMDEGRSAFPAESYLLWPPAILLTILLVSIALVGDTLRDSLDPKLHNH